MAFKLSQSGIYLPFPDLDSGASQLLKSYFEGSGKVTDPRCRYLTLAGLHGDDSAWKPYEEAWETVLRKHGAPYSHMRELLGNKGPFTTWSEKQKCDFVRDLFLCLTNVEKNGVFGSTLTVDLAEYRSIVRKPPPQP